MTAPPFSSNPWSRSSSARNSGNPWDPASWSGCPTDELVFDGPESERPDAATIEIDGLGLADQFTLIAKGILPRAPTDSELEYMPGYFPELAAKCWWVRDDESQGVYNCYGYCAGREAGRFQWLKGFDATYFAGLGFSKVRAGLFGKVPDDAEIAVFSGAHAARRSGYSQGRERLWESKLGDTIRIMHQLKELEGTSYGDVVEYWAKQ